MTCSKERKNTVGSEGSDVTNLPEGRTTHQRIADLVADGLWLEYLTGHHGFSDSEINEAVNRVVDLAIEQAGPPSST